jgi:hypothetical protein
MGGTCEPGACGRNPGGNTTADAKRLFHGFRVLSDKPDEIPQYIDINHAMTNFVSEFKAMAATYSEIGEELASALEVDDSQNSKSLIQSILANRDSLSRIGQMNSRVILVSDEWKKSRATIDSKSWDEINRLAENALRQAVRLNHLCSLTAKKLESAREKLGTALSEIGKGAQYLKSVKPAKSNYPKFIDSLY